MLGFHAPANWRIVEVVKFYCVQVDERLSFALSFFEMAMLSSCLCPKAALCLLQVEAHLLEKGKQEAVKKAKLGSTTQRQQEAERRRKEEVERYMKLAAKPPSEASPVRQTHYSGMKGASAAKAATPSKPSTLSLGDVQKTPPKLPTWQSATSTSTSKQSSQTVSHQPAKGFKQVRKHRGRNNLNNDIFSSFSKVPAGTKIFTPLQMPRVNVDGLRVAQKHVTDRAGSSQKTAVPLIPSLDSLRTHLTDSQHKASQPTANSNHSSSAGTF